MALDLGGILMGIGQQVFGTPAVQTAPVQTGVSTVGGQGTMAVGGPGGTIDSRAIPIISMILDGMNDSAVRSAARNAGVGKKALISTLMGLDMASQGQAFTGTQKMFLSNEIEKIFKPRPRSTIPKSLRRTVKQINWMKKNLRSVFK